MDPFYYTFIGIYFFILVILSIFGIHRYYLSYLYFRYRKNAVLNNPSFDSLVEIPFVTVQLPVFNEKYVLPRLVEAVCNLDYPKDRFEIQILDDSTDETVEVARRIVHAYSKKGYRISLIQRKNREGFKAGALKEGLKEAQGEFVAVFDADFVPDPDFLKKTIPHFSQDPKIGMVQARWGHLNADYSLLTKAQSIFLDAHFLIEHGARNRAGCFFNFNGTAGVWKKQCIEEAGGWEQDTLTEDLDLSYRAQLKGWRFLFLQNVISPAELPVEVNSFKAQQHRWAKGSIQTAKKIIPQILKAKLPFRVKLEALFHLTANFAYLLMVILSLLMPFSIYLRYKLGWTYSFYLDLPLFLSATFSVSFFYIYAQREGGGDWKRRLKYVPFSLALGIGLSVSNAKAVLEAIFNHATEFARTPKYGIEKKTDEWRNKKYIHQFNWVCFIELFLGIYFSLTLSYILEQQIYVSIPFIALFLIGFFYIALMGFFQTRIHWILSSKQQSDLPVKRYIKNLG